MRSRWQYTPTTDHVAGTAVSVAPPPAVPPEKAADPRWQQLVALIAQLPPDKAEKLRLMLAGDTLVKTSSAGFGQVLQALELRRGDVAIDKAPAEPLMRKVCVLLEPFLVNEGSEATAGTIGRKSLVPWWEASIAQSPALRRFDQEYHRAIREKLTAEMERLEDEAMAELTRLARSLALKPAPQSLIEDVRRIGTVLGGGRAFGAALTEMGIEGPPARPGIQLDEVIARRFRKAYDALGDERTFDPVWLGHAVMNHLDNPADAVGLIHRVTGCTDVMMLEQTELAPLMDRTIDNLVAVAARATAAIRTAADKRTATAIEAARDEAELYFELAEAITREIKLERASGWGQAYLTSRKSLSDLIPETLTAFEETIVDFLDDWAPDTYGRDEHPAYLAAMGAADFIGVMKLRAARHGFGMPFTTLERRLQDTLGRSMKRPRGNDPDPWPVQKRRLLTGLRLI